MLLVSSVLSAVMASHPGSAPVSAPLPRAGDERRWVAQADDEKKDEGGAARPSRPLPVAGPRRLLGREGLRAINRRSGVAEEEQRNEAPAAQPTGAAPPPAVPPPAAPPSAAPPPGAKSPAAAPAENNNIDLEARQQKGKFNFEFAKAEIMDVVKAISNLTQRNFIVPEKLKSQRITILSPSKITAAEAWQVFLAALEVNGITIVRAGKFYKLVEAKESIKSTIPTCIGTEEECPQASDQMVTLLLRLNHVDANQLTNVLKSLVSKDGEITVFPPSNVIIISEYARNLARVRRIMESLDVPGFQDELQIVQIEYATATEIADKLTQIFEVAGRGGAAGTARPTPTTPRRMKEPPQGAAPEGGDETGEVQISKIVPDDRTNQIIIKANRRSFDAIRRLIAKLDIPISDAEQGRVHVYYLENASAEELASTLSALAQGQAARPQGAAARPATQPGAPARQGAEAATAALFEGEIKITADKSTNSLLVMASGRDFRALRRIIEQLDLPRRQVYVEAAIMEVNVDDSVNFGTNWHTPLRFAEDDLPGGLGGPGTIGFLQNPPSGGISPTLLPLTNPAALLNIASGSIVGLIGESISIPVGDNSLTIPSFGVVLRALQSSSNAKVLSTPHILTTDNEEATIEVGRKIPFRRGTAIPSGVGALGAGVGADAGASLNQLSSLGSIFSATDRIDVSLKLTVTPQINESNRIRLDIDQQLEDVTGTDEATQQPITSKRSAKTVVVVEDQQTIVIGGLMRDIRTDSESKVPILGDIPVLGWLFKQRTRKTEKVNLVLVLTPYIIRGSSDFQDILERKVREYEEFAAEFYGYQKQYRAYIDYKRKSGPFARLAQAIDKAKQKAENGGPGDTGERIIRPSTPPEGENLLAPDGAPADDEPIPVPPELGSGGGESGGGPVEAAPAPSEVSGGEGEPSAPPQPQEQE